MTTEDESQVVTVVLPISLHNEIDAKLKEIEAATGNHVKRSDFYKESVWRYLEHLEKLSTQDMMLEDLTKNIRKYINSPEKKRVVTFRETRACVAMLDEICDFVNNKKVIDLVYTKSPFLQKAFEFHLEYLKKSRANLAIATLLKEKKDENTRKKQKRRINNG